MTANTSSPQDRPRQGLLILFGCLVVVLGFLFASSFRPEQALFANDGPLGAQASAIYKLPSAYFGIWSDQYWLGGNSGNYSPNFTGVLLWLLGPINFNKLYVPLAMFVLGLSAGYYFKRLGFKPAVCVLGGLAAALNSNFFSNACWGLSSRALSLAAIFLALAALQSGFTTSSAMRKLVLTILAGLGIGMSISEGGDNGAIFSLFVGAYAFYQCLFTGSPLGLRLLQGAGRVAILIVFSAILAAQTLNVFVSTSVKGIVGVESNEMSPAQKWSWATQWSLPPVETLRVVVPGLFGYRMDTPDGGNYWGGVGRDLAYDQTHQGLARHSGAGEYAGVLVVLLAFWSLLNAARRTDSAFTPIEKKMIWFWGASAVVSLVISWGHHAPFYQFIYKLPFFSTIRNPMKFMHPCHLCLLILFGYGLQGIWRRYLEPAPAKSGPFEKKWLLGSLAAVGLAVLALIVYAVSGEALVKQLMDNGFNDPSFARQMAQFSINEVKYSVFFLVASVIGVILIQRGVFAGPKARWAGVFLGALLVIDLARADAPWIKYFNYKDKYASNPALEVLATKPYEYRVTLSPFQTPGPFGLLSQYYGGEWLQHQFPFFNIQSLDQPQEPRMPADKLAYRTALATNMVRLWELTNTRFICGAAGSFAAALNQQIDPAKRRFRAHTTFNLVTKPGVSQATSLEDFEVKQTPNDPFALIEFTGALPRAKLYANWQVQTNDMTALHTLADPAFDPAQSVIVGQAIPTPTSTNAASPNVTAEIIHYSPKRIEVKTSSPVPSLLLMNNRFDDGWIVTVDGRPADLLRCNFLMQGVALPAQAQIVLFRYAPKSTIFFISFAAVLLGLALCGYLVVVHEKSAPSPDPLSPPAPTPKIKPAPRKS